MITYFICSVERSGSTLLAALLEGTGELGRPLTEPFRARVEADAVRTRTLESYSQYLEHALAASATENGVVGIKLMWRHLARMMFELRRGRPNVIDHDMSLLAKHFPGLSHFVLTQRRDMVAQAVSWAIAYQTDRWRNAHRGNGRSPQYSFRLIYMLHQNVVADSYGWESWFAANDIQPRRVVYEDWVADPRNILNDLSGLILGSPLDGAPVRNLPARQTSALNEEWQTKYKKDLSLYLGSDFPGSPRSDSQQWYGL